MIPFQKNECAVTSPMPVSLDAERVLEGKTGFTFGLSSSSSEGRRLTVEMLLRSSKRSRPERVRTQEGAQTASATGRDCTRASDVQIHYPTDQPPSL